MTAPTERDVVIVVAPPPPPGARGVAPRSGYHADELAAAVGATVVEGTLADVVGAGVILSFLPIRADTLAGAPGIAPRTVWMDAGRAPGAAIQTFGLAGAVSTLRYLEWSRHRDRDRAHNLWVRRDLAERLGATVDLLHDGDANVVRIVDDRHRDLAGLITALGAAVLGEPPRTP